MREPIKRKVRRMDGHDPWVQFWCGLIMGTTLGAVAGIDIFSSLRCVAATAVGGGLILGCSAARWGDPVWEFLGYLDLFF